jgi:DNA polymerase-3 subunit alpha
VAAKPDGAWVTVGGLITQAKRIRTKSGDPMMFATLDDLEGQVEMLIFNSAYASNESNVGVDKRVIVRGRVDHKDRGETKLVVQEAERFEPSSDEVAVAREKARKLAEPDVVTLRLDASRFGPTIIDDLKSIFANFPGEAEVLLEMSTRDGQRRLRFGKDYRVAPSAGLKAELDELLNSPPMAA